MVMIYIEFLSKAPGYYSTVVGKDYFHVTIQLQYSTSKQSIVAVSVFVLAREHTRRASVKFVRRTTVIGNPHDSDERKHQNRIVFLLSCARRNHHHDTSSSLWQRDELLALCCIV